MAFDDGNHLFVAKHGTNIYRLDQDGRSKLFAEVKSKTAKTYIWNLAWGKDRRLYAAAQDRILTFDTNGIASIFIEDKFTGPWGASDLDFDPKGSLYVVHGVTLSRYDASLRKENIIAYPLGELPPPVLVGIEFDAMGANMFLSYTFMRKVVRYNLTTEEGILATATAGGLPCPQYIAVDAEGNAYVTQPDANQVVKITTNGLSSVVAASSKLNGPNTIALGRGKFGTHTLYVTASDTIWQVRSESRR